MSKDSKQSMDPFTAELEKASLKDIQEAIIWKLGDIVKSSETIAELSGHCEDSFCHKDVLRCEQCGQDFRQRTELNIHLKQVHPKVPGDRSGFLKCPKCPKEFRTYSGRRKHVQKCTK